jgi:hypothetical protein
MGVRRSAGLLQLNRGDRYSHPGPRIEKPVDVVLVLVSEVDASVSILGVSSGLPRVEPFPGEHPAVAASKTFFCASNASKSSLHSSGVARSMVGTTGAGKELSL